MSDEHKSERIRAIAQANGWASQVVPSLSEFERTGNVSDISWILYCKRDNETIKAEWLGDRFQTSTYTYGSYRLYPARSGGIVKLLSSQPDVRKFNATAHSEIPDSDKNVPWQDAEEVTAFNVLVNVIDKDITWISKLSGATRTEHCPKDSNLRKAHFRVKTTTAGKRVLEWANPFGFQACYLADIIDVT